MWRPLSCVPKRVYTCNDRYSCKLVFTARYYKWALCLHHKISWATNPLHVSCSGYIKIRAKNYGQATPGRKIWYYKITLWDHSEEIVKLRNVGKGRKKVEYIISLGAHTALASYPGSREPGYEANTACFKGLGMHNCIMCNCMLHAFPSLWCTYQTCMQFHSLLWYQQH